MIQAVRSMAGEQFAQLSKRAVATLANSTASSSLNRAALNSRLAPSTITSVVERVAADSLPHLNHTSIRSLSTRHLARVAGMERTFSRTDTIAAGKPPLISMSEALKRYQCGRAPSKDKELTDKLKGASQDNYGDYTEVKDDRHRALPPATRRADGPYLDHIFEVATFAEKIDLGPIQRGFNNVTLDPYVMEGSRYKNIGRYRVFADRVESSPHGPMFQSSHYNPVNGDVTREYSEIPELMRDDPGFHQVVRTFAEQAHLPEGAEVIIHAQRTLMLPGKEDVFPTPEGWHQDGLDVIGIFCAARHNIVGAETFLALGKGEDIFLRGTLEEGELVLISDQDCFHFVSPFEAADPDKVAYRDAIIITYPSMRPPEGV